MLVFIIPVQIILILRTLALWDQKRGILIFLVAAVLATDITIVVSISLITTSLSFAQRPELRQVLGCFGDLDDLSTSKAIPSWAALMAFDTTVFVLTLIRVESMRRAKKDKSRLLNILFRDGIVFYLIMLASSIANLSLYAGLPIRRRGLIVSLIPLLRTVMSVCTARLLLNLRGAAAAASAHGNGHENWAFGELDASGASDALLAARHGMTSTAVSETATAVEHGKAPAYVLKEDVLQKDSLDGAIHGRPRGVQVHPARFPADIELIDIRPLASAV
ncbi:hypothetical protein EW145_g5664 [Phellinidium pouzarii]|uniref:Uncharacterized protein n=1 Tax=Phellinidium pouzarii TaxID=167371 RepID=A0A4S4KZ85_9AGAM|nr:hypothetical protein EW145_g5664 [Phellinidium pouzarii]